MSEGAKLKETELSPGNQREVKKRKTNFDYFDFTSFALCEKPT